jgi:hypothetical protein
LPSKTLFSPVEVIRTWWSRHPAVSVLMMTLFVGESYPESKHTFKERYIVELLKHKVAWFLSQFKAALIRKNAS